MERAGAEDMPEDAERKGLGTPATRAAILEKLVQMGFVQRKGKQLIPTKDGINLAVVLPEALTSPQLTAEWESRLTEIAKGQADPNEFMAGIEAMTRKLVKTYSCISEDKQKLFQAERVAIGTCPRCGEAVYEGRKNYYCGNEPPQIVRTAQKTPPKQGYEILSNILAPKFHRCLFCFSLDTLVVVEIDIIVNQFSSILESLNFHSMYTLSL